MAFIVKRTAQFYDKEVLKYPTGLEAIKSVVLDATTFAQNSDSNARTVVPAGTILRLSATNTKRYTEYDGVDPDGGVIKGILARPVDLLARSTPANEPAPAIFHSAVFATNALVGFTNYASALVSTLSNCRFE